MSFCRATIKRFNEEATSCAPPPNHYDPKLTPSAREIKFANYSGRTDPTKVKQDGAFVTPAKPVRGRSQLAGAASARSCSDTRLRRLRSTSTRSLNTDPVPHLNTPHHLNLFLDEKDRLEAELSDARSEVSLLRSNLEQLEQQYVSLQKSTEDEDVMIKQVTSAKEALEKELVEVKTGHALELKNLKTELNQQKENHTHAQQMYADLELKYSSVCVKIEDLENQTKEKVTMIGNLTTQLKNFQLDKDGLESKHLQLEETFQSLQLEKDEIMKKYDEVIQSQSVVAGQNEFLQKTIQDKEDIINALKSASESLHNELAETKGEHEAFVKNSDLRQAEALADFENQKDALTKEKQQLEEMLRSAQSEATLLASNLEQLEQQHASVVDQLQLLQKSTEDQDIMIKQVSSTKEALEQELAQVKADYSQELKNLEAELSAEKEKHEEVQQLQADLELKYATASSKIEELNEELEKQVKENATVIENITQHSQQLKNTELEKDALEIEKLQLEQDLENLKNENDEAMVKYEELLQNHSVTICQNEILQKTINDNQEVIKGLNSTLDSLRNEISAIKGEYNEFVKQSELNEAEALANFEGQKEALLNEKQQLEEMLTGSRNEVTLVTSNFEQLEQKHAALVSETELLQASLNDQNILIERMTSTKEVLEQELAQVKADYSQEVKNLEAELSVEKEKHEEVQQLRADLELKYATASSKIEELKEELETQAKENATVMENMTQQLKHTELEKDSLEIEKLRFEHDFENLKNENDDIIVKYEELLQSHSVTVCQNEILQKTTEDKEEVIQELNSALESLRNEISAIKGEYNEFVKQSELKEAEALAGFESQKEALLNENQQLEEMLSGARDEVTLVTSTLMQLEQQHTGLVDQTEMLQKSLGALEQELTEVKSGYTQELKNMETELADEKEKHAHTQQLHAELELKYSAVCSKADKLEEELVNQAKENSLAVENLSLQITNVQQVKESLENNYSQLEENFQNLKLENDGIIVRYSQLEESWKLLNSQKDELEKSLSDVRIEIEVLNSSNEKLKVEQSSLVRQNDLFQKSAAEKDVVISRVKSTNQALEMELTDVRTKYLQRIERLDAEINSQKQKREQAEKRSSELEVKHKSINAKFAEMNAKLTSLEADSAHVRQIMTENEILREKLSHYENKYGDYASLVGHQNNKQKIHHVIKIKDENILLRDQNARLRQEVADLKEKLKHAATVSGGSGNRRRFDPKDAFKPVLKEPFIRDERDVRGPDARGTFTVSKNPRPTPTVVVDSTRESRQGFAFDVTFTEDKENSNRY